MIFLFLHFQQAFLFAVVLMAVIGPTVLQSTPEPDDNYDTPTDVTYDDEDAQEEADQREYDESCISSFLICRSMPEGFIFKDVCLRDCQCRNQRPACPRTMCDPQISQLSIIHI